MPETDPTEPIEACRRLFRAIADFDVPAIQERYLQEDRLFIILEGPRSTSEGFDEERNRKGWSALLEQVRFFFFEFTDDMRAGRENDLAWVAGTLRYGYGPPGAARPATHAQSRGTWILERHGGDWRVVSEHVSFPLPDPYPLHA